MVPVWLHVLAIVSVLLGFVSAAIVAIDLIRHPQKMWIMNVVWPVTALYFSVITIWAYYQFGRMSAGDAPQDHSSHRGAKPKEAKDHVAAAERKTGKPFWQITALAVTHCGSGCTLGDIISEFAIFGLGLTFFASTLVTEFIGDYVLAFALGILFQYFTIAPMRNLGVRDGIVAALKADTLSLTAFEIGLFGWMALMNLVLFHPALKPDGWTYWFMMQVGMVLGYFTSYPVNWWLIKSGVKEAM